MSYSNPTPIRIGMNGKLAGQQYRVVGRVVLGEDEDGETYYWNEFNLESDGGQSATLVYEETERGGECRLFQLFEPQSPLTAAEAATKRAGDPVNLGGTQMFVRLVSRSRVYAIEGQAPEGEAVGSVAHYFNAVSGNTMVVVSWTGDEVEFYTGLDLSRTSVSSAFNVRLVDFSRLFPAPGGNRWLSGLAAGLASAVVFASLLALVYGAFRSGRRSPAIVRTGAPASPLAVGQAGTLGGTRLYVQSHLLVEMAMVGRKFDRHEYVLTDDAGTKALLVRGSKPGAGDWWLFQPLQPAAPLSPQQAAAVRWGQTVNVDGVVAKATDLFQATIRRVESPEASDLDAGDAFFGFAGRAQHAELLVRWNATCVNFFQGKALPEKEVLAAFGPPLRK